MQGKAAADFGEWDDIPLAFGSDGGEEIEVAGAILFTTSPGAGGAANRCTVAAFVPGSCELDLDLPDVAAGDNDAIEGQAFGGGCRDGKAALSGGYLELGFGDFAVPLG